MENKEKDSKLNNFFLEDQQKGLKTSRIQEKKNNELSRIKKESNYNDRKAKNLEVLDKKGKDNNLIVKILDRLIGTSIFMLFFGTPIYFSGLVSQGIIFEKQIFFYFWLLLGLVVWAAKGVVVGEIKIRRTPLDFPILGFWIVYAISTIFSVDHWHSFWGNFSDPSRGLLSVTSYVIAYYLIFSNFNSKRLRLILSALIGSGGIILIWSLLTALGVQLLPRNINSLAPLSLTGSITSLGIVLSLFIPLVMATILKISSTDFKNFKFKKATKNFSILALLILLIIDLFLILVFYNYVFWLGLFVGVIVFSIFVLAKIVRPSVKWVWLPMVVFVLIMAFKMIGVVSISKTTLPVEVSLNKETSMYIAKEGVKDNFIVGAGPASYGYNFSKHRSAEFNSNALYNVRFFQGTGLLLESLPTIGILGTFFLVILLLSYIGSQLYLLYRDKEKNKIYSLGIASAAAVLLTNILFVRFDGLVLILTILITTLALATTFLESDLENNNFTFSLKASPKFALTFAFVLMVVFTGVAFLFVVLGKVYVADFYAKKASNVISKNPEEAIEYLGKSIILNRQESTYFTRIGEYYMMLANKEIEQNKDSQNYDAAFNYLNKAIASANQGVMMSTDNISAIESLALIYENTSFYIADSLGFAEENYQKALVLEPNNPVYYLKLGQVKISMAQGEADVEKRKIIVREAKEFFQQSIGKKKDYVDGYHQLALTHEALGELDQAVENGIKAVQLNSEDSNYLISLGRMYQSRNSDGDMMLAQKYYERTISLNANDVNGHFYLGLLHEKEAEDDKAKNEYKQIINILKGKSDKQDNSDAIEKLEKMIENIDNGIKNTPESLNLIEESTQQPDQDDLEIDVQAEEDEKPPVINNYEKTNLDEVNIKEKEEGVVGEVSSEPIESN